MSISKEEFCKIETMLTGEELNYVEQLKYKSFSGLELLEYLNDFYELYNDYKQAESMLARQLPTTLSGLQKWQKSKPKISVLPKHYRHKTTLN